MFSFLMVELTGAKPDIKFCLVKLSIHYDMTMPINEKIQDISRTIGVSPKLIRMTFLYLEQNSLVEIECLSTPKGVARRSYKLLGMLARGIKKNPSTSLWEKRQFELMLSIFTIEIDLSRPAIVLYAILLFNSDEVGVVEGLGYRELIDLLGASKSSVGRYINELLQKGYLRHVVSAKGNSLFGIAPSIYYLNLTHSYVPASKGHISTYIFDVCDQPELEAYTVCRIASLLCNRYKKEDMVNSPRSKRLLVRQQSVMLSGSRLMGGWKVGLALTGVEAPLLKQINELKEVFAKGKLTASYLQAVIEILASKILIHSWGAFDSKGKQELEIADNDEYIDFIYSHLLLNDEKTNCKAVNLIYSVAFYLAWTAFVEIVRTNGKEFKPSLETRFLLRVISTGRHQSLIVQCVNYSEIKVEKICYI